MHANHRQLTVSSWQLPPAELITDDRLAITEAAGGRV